MKPTIKDITSVMQHKGYSVYQKDDKLYNINIVGIRNSDMNANTFNDTLCVFWKYKGVDNLKTYSITTDPGKEYRLSPLNEEGTAIVIPGQYNGLWKIGLHKGQYEALVQKEKVGVIRDFNKDSYLDCSIPTIYDRIDKSSNPVSIKYKYVLDDKVICIVEYGLFGINCHRSSITGTSTIVDKWSAGCQVFASINDFKEFMIICNNSARVFGNSFTYTLLDERDFI